MHLGNSQLRIVFYKDFIYGDILGNRAYDMHFGTLVAEVCWYLEIIWNPLKARKNASFFCSALKNSKGTFWKPNDILATPASSDLNSFRIVFLAESCSAQ